MSSTRFNLDPDRIFPDHAYAPGYEPSQVPKEDPPPPTLTPGDMVGFVTAAGLLTAALTSVSVALLRF